MVNKENTTDEQIDSINNVHHLNPEENLNDIDSEEKTKTWNKLGLVMGVGATIIFPPLLGHYIRRKNGNINKWLVGLGIAVSVAGSVYQNPEQFKFEDTYLSKIQYNTKHPGIEQYLISRNESEVEVFQNNNKKITNFKGISIENFLYSTSHTLSNLITPWSISQGINKIQGNTPTKVNELIGFFSYDVNDSIYTVNPNKKGIGNCNFVISQNNITFNNLEKEIAKCEQAYNSLK